VIKAEKLTKKYGTTLAVDNLNLEIPPGEIFGFLGSNGAGKTTTVKLFTGLTRPTSGKTLVGGYDVLLNPIEAKRLIGYIPDEPYIYPKLTGCEFLDFVGEVYNIPHDEIQATTERLFQQFGLIEYSGTLIEEYSHGMRQKLLYTALLLHKPRAIFLDEPLVGLDPTISRIVKNTLNELAGKGAAIFMCTHVLEIAEKLCHRVGIIDRGHLIAIGTIDELRNQAGSRGDLEDVFFTLTNC
jgi:ABC-2 type transport system ATP-binding protein